MARDIKLLNFNFTKISIERAQKFTGSLEIKSDINIKNVEKQRNDLIKEDSLKIDFSFVIDYGELGRVAMDGFLSLLLDSKSTKDLLSEWKDKSIEKPSEIKMVVLNLILQKCSLRALQLEDEMGLPLHIQMPKLKVNPEEGSK